MQKFMLPTNQDRQRKQPEEGPERGKFRKQRRQIMLDILRNKADDEG